MPLKRILTASVVLAAPAWAAAAGVSPRFDLASPAGSPFPSDRFTVADFGQKTLRRVKLPLPDCTQLPSDCADVHVINTLDGFNVQPRLTVPFTGAIDPATVTSQTVWLLNLGDTLTGHGFGQKVGINQVVWDEATQVLSFESDEQLQEHTRYVLVVTNGVRDTSGAPVEPGAFGRFEVALDAAQARNADLAAYRKLLVEALRSCGTGPRIVAASLFTTQSTTSHLEKIRRQIQRTKPAPIEFQVGQSAAGPVRANFAVADVAAIQWVRQTGTAPAFTTSFVPTPALAAVPGVVGQIAYGTFRSPNYLNADIVLPATPTLIGEPQPLGANTLTAQVFLPAGPRPAAGWPVAIFGHGFSDSVYGGPWTLAAVLASKGIASIGINAVGHGGGPLGTLNVVRNSAGPVSVPAGGRGIDQDHNGTIDATEGLSAVGVNSIVSNRDGLRQTVVDLLQLVRQVQVGVDVDGDGAPDLDANRIYYTGQSLGGIYGTALLAIEPALKAGVPNVAGGSLTDVSRLGLFRPLAGAYLAGRKPSLINLPDPSGIAFFENIPLRNLAPVVNQVPGAIAIQQVFDRNEWVQQSGNPVAYASALRKRPLPGNAAKPVIVQFALGDLVVPNPANTALVRAGDLADRTTMFRNDLAYGANPAVGKAGHTFLTNLAVPAAAPFALAAQAQIATFFASNGATFIDPDGAGPFFETPASTLPERLNFIP